MRRQEKWWSKGKICSRTNIQLLQKWSGREGRKHQIIWVWNQVLKQQEYVHRWDLELGLERRCRKNTAIIFREFNRILQNISFLALVSETEKRSWSPLCLHSAPVRATLLTNHSSVTQCPVPRILKSQLWLPVLVPNHQWLCISSMAQYSGKIQYFWC